MFIQILSVTRIQTIHSNLLNKKTKKSPYENKGFFLSNFNKIEREITRVTLFQIYIFHNLP